MGGKAVSAYPQSSFRGFAEREEPGTQFFFSLSCEAKNNVWVPDSRLLPRSGMTLLCQPAESPDVAP